MTYIVKRGFSIDMQAITIDKYKLISNIKTITI